MSFFDEVETTVANTRFLQAIEDTAPIQLQFRKFDELKQLDDAVRPTVNIDTCMKKESLAYYSFKQYLRSQQQDDVVHLLTCIEYYSKKAAASRQKLLKQMQTLHPPLFSTLEKEKAKENNATRDTQSVSAVHVSTIKVEQKKDDAAATTPPPIFYDFETVMTECPSNHRFCMTLLTECPKEVEDFQSQALSTNAPIELFQPLFDRIKHLLSEHVSSFISSPQYERYIQLLDYAKRGVKLSDFRIFRVLGRGAFGAVSAVQKIDTHAVFAMKEMGKKQVKQDQSEWMVVNEKKILSKMHSPFVLGLNYAFHEEDTLFLIFDMCSGGDLKFHLRAAKDKCFDPARAKFYAAEVLLGLEHIHSLDIVYRDLKPNNILLDQSGHVKISDLGLSIKLRKNKSLKHLAGTAGYWAPEIVSKLGTHLTSDYWSFGTFLYEMLTGKRPNCTCAKKSKEWCPFGQKRSMEENAVDPEGVLKLEVDYPPSHISPDCKDLLQQLFNVDPKSRLGAKGIHEIKSHRYFADVDWEAMKCMEVPPPFVPDARTVNANSIGEVGEFNKTQFKHVQLQADDEKHYEDFVYTSQDGVEQELVEALIKMDYPHQHAAGKGGGKSESTSSCCTIL